MISDDLRSGLAALHRRGWKNGSYGAQGRVCMISALPPDAIGRCRPYLRDAIRALHGPLWNVNAWQDMPGRKFREVERVYEEAVVLAQIEEMVAA